VDRHGWALSLLDLHPDSSVLELGCGRGATAALVRPAVERGRYVGVDRSAVAVAAASERVPGAVFLRERLDRLSLTERFDRVLAVNVNVFWTGPAVRELAVVRRMLHPGGRLVLVYELPGSRAGGRDVRVEGRLVEHLSAAELTAELLHEPTRGLLGVVAAAPRVEDRS
jgi:SAM-dependent methyltransferase